MNSNPALAQGLELQPGYPRRIDAAAGTVIRVEHGRVWLTLSALHDDVVLNAGESFTAPHAGRVVVETWPHRHAMTIATIDVRLCAALPGSTQSNAAQTMPTEA